MKYLEIGFCIFLQGHSVPNDGANSLNDTFDCEEGGSVNIVSDVTETGGMVKVTYSNCEATRYMGGTGYHLKLNGTVSLSGTQSEDSAHTTFRQSMSFGGDLGFAATCDYSLDMATGSVTYEGSCSYEDSDGKKLEYNLDNLN